jgi:hypothetical protein
LKAQARPMRTLRSDARIYLHIHSDDVSGPTLESLALSLDTFIRAAIAVLLLLEMALNVARELWNMPAEMVEIGTWLVRQSILIAAYLLAWGALRRIRFRMVA